VLSLLGPKCLFHAITFSGESDYGLSNVCRSIYFVMHSLWCDFNQKFRDYSVIDC